MNRKTFCCIFIGIVLTVSSFTNCAGARISCCIKFLVPSRVSCVLVDVEFKLLLLVFSLIFAL